MRCDEATRGAGGEGLFQKPLERSRSRFTGLCRLSSACERSALTRFGAVGDNAHSFERAVRGSRGWGEGTQFRRRAIVSVYGVSTSSGPARRFWQIVASDLATKQVWWDAPARTRSQASIFPFASTEENTTAKARGHRRWCCPSGYSNVHVRWSNLQR